jgi:VanZ family protein
VPLDFHPITLLQAWQILLDAPMLAVGVQGRADWIANGVLYLPVGFLGCVVLLGRQPETPSLWRRLLAGAVALAAATLLALALEFAQTAFPPRTVSRNDLASEAIGSALGMLLAQVGAARFHLLLRGLGQGGAPLLKALGRVYALGYGAWALFPFDLLLTAQEWQEKLGGPLLGAWLAGASVEQETIRTAAKLALETLVVLPLGALWAAWPSPRQDGMSGMSGRVGLASTLLRASVVGALIGLLIEAAQLAIASGLSQGVSLLTRSTGFALGAAAWHGTTALRVESARAALRRLTPPAVLLYLGLLTEVHGWWRGPWLGLQPALRRLHDDVRFLPLYYHYYSTEAHAVTSMAMVIAGYAPVSLICWVWNIDAWLAGAVAALLAAMVEAGRLMAGGKPDPSNVVIAWIGVWGLGRLLSLVSAPRPAEAGRPPWGSSKVAKPHLLESRPSARGLR